MAGYRYSESLRWIWTNWCGFLWVDYIISGVNRTQVHSFMGGAQMLPALSKASMLETAEGSQMQLVVVQPLIGCKAHVRPPHPVICQAAISCRQPVVGGVLIPASGGSPNPTCRQRRSMGRSDDDLETTSSFGSTLSIRAAFLKDSTDCS